MRAPQVRGRWREIQLERVVESAGMIRHCVFLMPRRVVSGSRTGRGEGDRTVRLDLVVRRAGGRRMVDATVPFAAYLDARDPDVRAEQLTRHAEHLRAHVDQLPGKAYWAARDPAPEFVVLFVPGDPFFDAALSTGFELLEYSFGRDVILATPTTLIALPRTIAFGRRQQALPKDMATVRRLGRGLCQRLGTTGENLDRPGAQLGGAVAAFDDGVASVESRVTLTARKPHEPATTEQEVPEIGRVDSRPRAESFADAGE
ncbi:DNA recombination protein RmuC [Nocardia beijingensis]|uniref:DNA recombination protein RmuC n=1 Tax=Nocardia beijingensis TaxID=95162 RepID=UPI0033FB8224